MSGLVIAVDGPAASGKSTLASRLAADLGLHFLDTGLIYRAVGARVLGEGGDPDDAADAQVAAEGLAETDLARPDLHTPEVSQAASKVAAHQDVRGVLLDYQRRFAAREPGAVLAGRDIGTVVCADARRKIFVTASVEERARRRFEELRRREAGVIYDTVLQDLRERDRRDQSRAVAPLKPAADAYVLDTTAMDTEMAFEAARAFVIGNT
ncbi:(d)CMP kinase [Marinivivus vitaminiproducens]|uniref:(d)CMP kinase n=1 Tax=Marinivivus vitaminiproducens TaxID=3035935 RepID=UPI0027A9CDB3|nr:(d)CMP kinase [Geminicoccaceae bacterium SCSIO 64248]